MKCKTRTTMRCAAPRLRFAGLVDIENTMIVKGRLLPASEGEVLLTAAGKYLGGMPVQVATGENVLRRHMTAVVTRGWIPALVPNEPDAADRALLDAGRALVSAGVTDLVVVSGDHIFTELAAIARLHVIAHEDHLSKALRLAAATVAYLPRPEVLVEAVA